MKNRPLLDVTPAHEVAPVDLGQADDATLALAMMARHPEAPRVVWSRFSALVRRIVRRSFGSQQDVEDIVQDVFVTLFTKPALLREPASLRAFILSVTLRNIRYEIRRRWVRRWVGIAPNSELPDIRVVESNPESREALARLYGILDRIRTRDRLAFVLRFVEGMEVAEVAAALETSEPTARRCFTRAYRRVSLLAVRDPYLSEYLVKLRGGAP